MAYRKAIHDACRRAGSPPWNPHQLRHAAADRFRRTAGLDVAQAPLGPKHAQVTETYAPVELDARVAKLVRKHG